MWHLTVLCGGGGAGGSQGDLYVFVKVKEHGELRREGLTVHSDVTVSYIDAILGMRSPMSLCVLNVLSSVSLEALSSVAAWLALSPLCREAAMLW